MELHEVLPIPRVNNSEISVEHVTFAEIHCFKRKKQVVAYSYGIIIYLFAVSVKTTARINAKASGITKNDLENALIIRR